MVAKRNEVSRHVLGSEGLPKYVFHPEFKYSSDSREYLDGLEELLQVEGPPEGDAEVRLFRAMHYCAFRAWEARGKRRAVTAEANRWIELRARVRDHLILVNLGLSYDMVRRSRFTNVDEDDLLSEGLRALCDAVEAFDPWRGYRFSTYACNAIYRGFLRLSKMETRRARFVTFGYDPRMDRGALDGNLNDYDERVYRQRLAEVLRENGADLTEQERDILSRRFPEEPNRKRETLERIGREMSVSKERVRQIQVTALEKLYQSLTADPVLC
ncbi:MAG TPA: sigma-70 family RNA polymerase sigma factor [Phycisphaerae bacterium]|nr:sigma-70 family RNA polymerase sigma factor [Phycisphaerales bacterium]HRX84326.1 sigma-70 family RNA polymerase sigma factor [Phycisphaerae bacterium]